MHNDLYGTKSADIDRIRLKVEGALDCKLTPHDSTYVGDYFRADLMNGEKIILQRNIDPLDGKPSETKFSRYRCLIYISNTARSSDIKQALRRSGAGLTLLRHK